MGRGWVEAQTHVPTAARATVVTLAQALTLHAGPGTGLALPPQARRDGVVLDKPQESGGETARAQRTTQTSLRRRDARQMSRRKGIGIWGATGAQGQEVRLVPVRAWQSTRARQADKTQVVWSAGGARTA